MNSKHRSKSEFQEENEQVVIMKSRKVQSKGKRAGYKKLRDKIMTDVPSCSNPMTMNSYEGKWWLIIRSLNNKFYEKTFQIKLKKQKF